MPTIKQVLEKFAENPAETFGQLLAAVDHLYERVEYLEKLLSETDTEHPDNWDNEETHLS